MGRRGPAPKPVAAKLRDGETRPSRVNFEQPLPRQRLPRKPDGMDTYAKAVWDHVIREMGDSGVIVGADRDVLRAYCEAVSAYTRDVKLLAGAGSVIRGARGRDVVVNPLHRVVREEREAIRLLARELGLSPSARAGLRIDLSAPSGDLDAVLGPPPRLRVVGGEPDE